MFLAAASSLLTPALSAFSAAAPAAAASGGGGGAMPPPNEMFLQLFSHVQSYPLMSFEMGGTVVTITNHSVLQGIAALLALLIFSAVARLSARTGQARGAFANAFEAVVMYVRDEMVCRVMIKSHAEKLMPLFLTFFVFILFCNLLGLFPIPGVGGTATANINVTAGLATITLFMMIFGGMLIVGPFKFWTSLVPGGLPLPMIPFMFVIEVIGLFIKAFALTVRLFANMIAGHLVILSFFGLAFLLESYIVMLPAVVLAVFITLLEVLVAFLQAYVFTFLSIIFVSMAIHPDH